MLMSDEEYDRRYAADMRHEALIEAVAKGLCEACYGAGAWHNLAAQHHHAQINSWKAQAHVAVSIVRDWTQ